MMRYGGTFKVVGFTTTVPVQSVPITTKVVSSNHTNGEWNLIQYVKVCQWLAAGQWFSPGNPVSSTIKTDCLDIAKILLKVALNPLTLTPLIPASAPLTSLGLFTS